MRDFEVCFGFISSKIEHHAVIHTLHELEKDYNVKVSFVKLDKNGVVDYDKNSMEYKNLMEKTNVTNFVPKEKKEDQWSENNKVSI